VHRALMGTDDAQDRGQTQATAQEFGGKEWIEYMFERLGRHATAVVADFETDILPFAQIGAEDSIAQEFTICPEHQCRNSNHAPALADGFRSIDRKIEQDLSYLGSITRDRRQSLCELAIDNGLLAHGEPDEI